MDALLEAGVPRVVAGSRDPNPDLAPASTARASRGRDRARAAARGGERQNEAFRAWVSDERPFVAYKAAITLDGRVTVPGSRWVSGEACRRLVHELRAGSDAVAVGMGTVPAEDPS